MADKEIGTTRRLTEITDPEFERFRDFFYRKTGIKFENSKRYFVDKRLIERIYATGNNSFRSYFTQMRFQASGEEVQQLINCMTVNETYFYREEYQFEVMVENVMNEIAANKKDKSDIRIWSIPSSTGEEPYSIALYLLEYWPQIQHLDVEIVSSDIDSKVLQACHAGVYNERSVKHLPARTLKKYFSETAQGNYQLNKDIRDAVKFSKVNLSDINETKHYRNFDLIFCRNLLIYFDDESRKEAANVFYDALNPGGFIFLGHSESMSRISSLFKVKKYPKAIVYQRPLTGENK
ncbi:protein-glutamate O-methyltransferase CheR [Glaciecola sp. MH2013]|nr:protein-glutamate O-methyltransferase CheR [Glaciecola sp. MH2013]